MYWPIGVPSVYAAPRRKYKHVAHSLQNTESNRTDQAAIADDTRPSLSITDDLDDGIDDILDIHASKTGEVFASITRDSLSIWQARPVAILATVIRSDSAIKADGRNVTVLLQPNASLVTIRTDKDRLVVYSLTYSPDVSVYRTRLAAGSSASRSYRKAGFEPEHEYGPGDGQGIRQALLTYKTTVNFEHAITASHVLEDAILVATKNPATIQVVKTPQSQALDADAADISDLSHLPLLSADSCITSLAYDRPMRLYIWITHDGQAYAVQRQPATDDATPWQGFCFHLPQDKAAKAVKAVINARFSLIAVACSDCVIRIYHAKDYTGNVPLSHALQVDPEQDVTGHVEFMQYSADGNCLFVGYEKGWAMWSVYGKLGANSFEAVSSQINSVSALPWHGRTRNGFWTVAGSGMMLIGNPANQIYALDIARASATTCFNMANVSRMPLQTSTSVMLYRGLQGSEMSTLTRDVSMWQTVQLPTTFLARQWPLRSSVVSPDGSYLAVAGRRGLAHYSLSSGRWRTFADLDLEDEFVVRGGMCWSQHVLIAAIDADQKYQIRIYSREKPLDRASVLHTEHLDHAVIHMCISGQDSLLVYTHGNVLHHFVLVRDQDSMYIEQIGQIGFQGIIRAPARVRSMCWIVPGQSVDADVSPQDVASATVMFLIDAKLVLLLPYADDQGMLKYDMKVLADQVEYYLLTRDTICTQDHVLGDSLMCFDGESMLFWPNVASVIASAAVGDKSMLPEPISMTPDFYPLAGMIEAGLLYGVEPSIVQRRNVDFAYSRINIRTHLAIPPILHRHLVDGDTDTAHRLAASYAHLPYFAHALEILLHGALEQEVAKDSSDPDDASKKTTQLQVVLSFLSCYPCQLEVIVGCARKTEVRTWQTLFKHLAPIRQLFDDALASGELKIASGLLLVLHTLDEASFDSKTIARMFEAASEAGDLELCKEVARFLVGIDDSGQLLRDSLVAAGVQEG